MSYSRDIAIEFNHCDPAGIVFYPRYFEMTNSVVENFFGREIGYSFARIVAEGCGVPTVRIEVDFRAPSRLGDIIRIALTVVHLGTSSARVRQVSQCDGHVRFEAELTLVWVGRDGRAAPWPSQIRERLQTAIRAEGAQA